MQGIMNALSWLIGIVQMFWFPVGLVLLSILGVRAGSKTKKLGNKLLLFIGSLIPVVLAGALWLFLIAIGSVIYRQESIIVLAVLLLLAVWMGLKVFGGWKAKKVRKGFLTVCLCALLAIGSFYGWFFYDQSIAKLNEDSFVLNEYRPNRENSKCVSLDEPSELNLSGTLRLDGATALYPVYAAFAQATYPAEVLSDANPYIHDSIVRCTTTTNAYEALIDGKVDIIFVAGSSQAQAEYARSKGEEMIFTPIGCDAFVFFVNTKNPIDSLTVSQLRNIYSGQITDWSEMGSNLGVIRAFQRDEGSGSQSQMVRFMGGTELMQPPEENVIANMGGIIQAVADYKNYKNAIGYSFRFYAETMMPDDQIKLLAIGGIEPTKENIANGSYPLAGQFYAVHLASNDNPEIEPFIEWMLSSQGQQLIEKTGYVPLEPQK